MSLRVLSTNRRSLGSPANRSSTGLAARAGTTIAPRSASTAQRAIQYVVATAGPNEFGPTSNGLADEAHHHAENLQRAFGTDDGIRFVLGTQDEAPTLEVEPLERKLIVDDRDDDLSAASGVALFDHDEIAVENAGFLHRVSLHAYENRLRRALDQVVVDRQRVGRRLVDRIRQAGMDRRVGQRTLEEAARRREPAIGGRFDEPGKL